MVNEIFPTCHDCPYYQERSLRSPPPTKKKKKKDRPPTNLVQSLPHLKSPTGDIKINKQQSRKHRQRHTTILTKKKKRQTHTTLGKWGTELLSNDPINQTCRLSSLFHDLKMKLQASGEWEPNKGKGTILFLWSSRHCYLQLELNYLQLSNNSFALQFKWEIIRHSFHSNHEVKAPITSCHSGNTPFPEWNLEMDGAFTPRVSVWKYSLTLPEYRLNSIRRESIIKSLKLESAMEKKMIRW